MGRSNKGGAANWFGDVAQRAQTDGFPALLEREHEHEHQTDRQTDTPNKSNSPASPRKTRLRTDWR
jgi:hypothetical protein